MQTFLLALEAALYPTLLAAVVILLSQPRPRRLLGAYLAGGFITSIGLGHRFVFKLKDSNAVSGGGSVLSWGGSAVSWGDGRALGGLALLVAVPLATRTDDHLRQRRPQGKAENGNA